MTLRPRAVSVKLLPAIVDAKSERLFSRELEFSINRERPAIVLDCSRLGEMDADAIHLLLRCLENAMKRNGDVRLACVPPRGLDSLRSHGAERLFRFFDTVEQAVDSFQRRAATALHAYSHSKVVSEHAA